MERCARLRPGAKTLHADVCTSPWQAEWGNRDCAKRACPRQCYRCSERSAGVVRPLKDTRGATVVPKGQSRGQQAQPPASLALLPVVASGNRSTPSHPGLPSDGLHPATTRVGGAFRSTLALRTPLFASRLLKKALARDLDFRSTKRASNGSTTKPLILSVATTYIRVLPLLNQPENIGYVATVSRPEDQKTRFPQLFLRAPSNRDQKLDQKLF